MEWMFEPINNMNFTVCFGFPILLNNGMDSCKFPQPSWVLALVNGMDAVSS